MSFVFSFREFLGEFGGSDYQEEYLRRVGNELEFFSLERRSFM